MSRASISTGDILFKTNEQADSNQPKEIDNEAPMHIAIIGDFSGRGSRNTLDSQLLNRRAIEIDRDNFDEVFSSLKVQLDLPFADSTISFSDIDDLHPDFLYEKADALFSQFRNLRRRLKKPEHFQKAVDDLQNIIDVPEAISANQAKENTGNQENLESSPSMLDSLLSQSTNQQSPSIENIDALIKSIVSPYVEAKTDPRLPEMEKAVDNATAQTLRKIMHTGCFKALESNWRAVELLVRRIETNKKLKLFIIDVCEEEILDDIINQTTIEDTQLYKLLVEKYQTPGAIGFSLMQFDLTIGDKLEDIRLASALSTIAQASQAYATAAASSELAGCANFCNAEDTDEWNYEIDTEFSEAWNTFRDEKSSEHLALVAPRFLIRQPYGKRSSPIESFEFEELGDNNPHEYYCWANSATLVSLLVAESYKLKGWQFNAGQRHEIKPLPVHIYEDEDGDKVAKPVAEVYLRDSGAQRLAEQGIMSARSVKNSDAVLIPHWRSVSISGKEIFS